MAYINGLHGEKAKEARRIKYGIPTGTKAGKSYVENVWLPAQAASANPQPTNPGSTASEGAGGFLDSLPKKIAGMPTWMMLTGAGIVMMFMFKGGRKR